MFLMFTKLRHGYHYDPDPIREPLKSSPTIPGNNIGRNRRNGDRTEHVWSNPMGRNSGAVWSIPPSGYRGGHPAAMPEALVRRCLLASCPKNGLVLDPFGGAGTTALVALQLGHRAMTIEINPAYIEEARQRLAAEWDDLDEGSLTVAAEDVIVDRLSEGLPGFLHLTNCKHR
jgi:DNA modification methylase